MKSTNKNWRRSVASNHQTGIWAEYLAALILTLKGYRIVTLRAKTPVGEIDVLAAKGKTLIAVEVKASKNFDRTAIRVDGRKRERVARCLDWWRTQRRYQSYVDFRFDVIAIAPWRFYHIMNAW